MHSNKIDDATTYLKNCRANITACRKKYQSYLKTVVVSIKDINGDEKVT